MNHLILSSRTEVHADNLHLFLWIVQPYHVEFLDDVIIFEFS